MTNINLTPLELELQKALRLISPQWDMQNNYDDRLSNFIYTVKTVDSCIELAEKNGISVDYALHRWYNFRTSIQCEQIFCDYGAIKETDFRNKEIDIYINGTPFDVKLTVYPKALSNHPFNLSTRAGRNAMIEWMYLHQSQQQRKHLANRLFIVCDGRTQYDSLKLKSDFIQIRKKVQLFLTYIQAHGFNELDIVDLGVKHHVTSEIICIN